MERSLEYRTDVVEGLYARLLGRAAEPLGLNYWVNLLGRGATSEQLEASFLGSEEYFLRRGGGSITGWLTATYRDTLNRIQGESQRLRSIVEDLLWLARFDSRPPPPGDQPLDLEVIARDCADRFGSVARAQSLSVLVEPAGPALTFHTDGAAIVSTDTETRPANIGVVWMMRVR